MSRYRNRTDAGQQLASAVVERLGPALDDALVFALPRGGVPVAAEVATALGCPLDVLVVRKLGMPFDPEFAFGAISTGGACYLNPEIMARGILTEPQINEVKAEQEQELARRDHLYRGVKPLPNLTNKTVIVVDDGIATGATMRAALMAVRNLGAKRVVLAVPVAPEESVLEFADLADDFICPLLPAHLGSVGQFYEDFSQVSDEQVLQHLGHG
ncbi:MAG: hypothetical protein RLZZ404_156 [Actinomycetota bacterium]|jgi:putative phosphoribosyl transferase